MRGSARPTVVLCALNEACPNRISLDIAHGVPKVDLIHHRRIEPALPEVASTVIQAIEQRGICSIDTLNRFRKGTFVAWNRDQVYMIRHQAIRPDSKYISLNVFPQQT